MAKAKAPTERTRLDELRAELHRCYEAEERPYGRIEELAAEIAAIQNEED
jgi:hypothetical protein